MSCIKCDLSEERGRHFCHFCNCWYVGSGGPLPDRDKEEIQLRHRLEEIETEKYREELVRNRDKEEEKTSCPNCHETQCGCSFDGDKWTFAPRPQR